MPFRSRVVLSCVVPMDGVASIDCFYDLYALDANKGLPIFFSY